MRAETFFWIISDDGKIHSIKYALKELRDAEKKLEEMARANKGMKFHLMKRRISVISDDLTWEDSEV